VLSAFRIDFAAAEFAWALLGGLVLTFVLRRPVHRMHRLLRTFSSYPVVPAVGLAVAMFCIQFAVATRYGWPVPALHDEFSYLLAADTFAEGRATNPTHPAWEFLETYHVLWHPTYQSKYPPGNGLVLAVGQVVGGQPIVGIWICLALCAALTFWMLRGWFSIVWAVVGATILLCNWPVTKLWGQTYYGGAPALLGGLLLFGAAARLQRGPSFINSLWLSLGLLILAVTRPYEGLIASLPVLLVLSIRAVKASRGLRRQWLLSVLLPACLVLTCGFAALGWYHWRVTGSPWVWPYRLYEATYTRRTNVFNTLLSFTDLGPRGRTIPSLEYESSAAMRRIAETKPVWYGVWKAGRQWWFHVGLLATLPLLLVIFRQFLLWRSRPTSVVARASQPVSRPKNLATAPIKNDASKLGISANNTSLATTWEGRATALADSPVRKPRGRILVNLALWTIGLVAAAILLQRTAGHPHYAAPVQPLILVLIIQGLRILRTGRVARYRFGPDAVSWFIWSTALFFVLPLFTGTNQPQPRPWSLERARLLSELVQRSRPQLVIVRYAAKHSMHEEWVYNRANIDQAHVIWARDLGEKRTAELLKLFPDREVTVIER
jgi:hypothetical protein